MNKILVIVALIVIVGIVSILIFPQEEAIIQKQTQSIPELRVAFIGDQGLGPNAIAVLELIKDEGAQMVLHQGDFDYKDDPDAWDKQISDVLGDDFLYFASIGHHDMNVLSGYQEKLYDRLKKNPDAVCNGDLGVKSSCTYQGLFFILIAPGDYTNNSDYDSFIEKQLNDNNSNWRICSWHNDMNTLQTEVKLNETGWEVYESCKNGGAIIANAHMHFYARSTTLTDIENQIVDPAWSEPNKLRVMDGATFTFISGLGGMPISGQVYDEWPINYSSDQGATYGALFCTFNAGGQPNKAYCYFKNIDGRIIDEFTITSFLGTYHDSTNLIDVDMSGRDLTGDDLSNTVIIDSNLSNAILIGADLSNAVLIGTTLTGADLTNANLTGVSLTDKDLTGTILRGADLTDANLTGVDLSGRDLTGTILRGLDLTDKDLTGTILRGADLTDANLSGQDLSVHDLTDVILTGADLSNSLLPDNGLSGKDFERTIFDGVNLSGKDLSKSNFQYASFKNTNLKNVNLSQAKFIDVDLTKIKSLAGANLNNTVITYSNLSGNNLDRITLYITNFQGSNLSGLDFSVVLNKSIEGVRFQGTDLSNASFEGISFVMKGDLGKLTIKDGAYLADKSLDELTRKLFEDKYESPYFVTKKHVFGNDLILEYILFNNFTLANLQNVNFSNADLTQAVFRDANLTNANLSNAVLKAANLSNANLQNVNFSNADLTQAFLRDADLTNANLSNVILTGANLTNATLNDVLLVEAILNCKNHPVCVN